MSRLVDTFGNPLISPQSLMAQGGYDGGLRNYWFTHIQDLPIFTFYTIQHMLNEPSIILGLAMREAPICNSEFGYLEDNKWHQGVKSSDPEVSRFVYKLLHRLWTYEIHKLVESQIWGWTGGEILWGLKFDEEFQRKMIVFNRLEQALSRDVRTLRHEDRGIVGVSVRTATTPDGDSLRMSMPGKGWWAAHRPEPGTDYGRSILRGAYSPFADKWFDGGAKDVRRLYMHADAYSGRKIGYPRGSTRVGDKNIPNVDIAREIAENSKSGEVITYPVEYDDAGRLKWIIDDPRSGGSGAQHILQYPQDLDIEQLRGMEIPDDVLTSELSGAWAGKNVPLMAFLSGLRRFALQLLRVAVNLVAEPAVMWNFGRAVDFEVSILPFDAQFMMKQQAMLQAQQQQDDSASGEDPLGIFGRSRRPITNGQANQNIAQSRMSLDYGIRDRANLNGTFEAVGNGEISAASLIDTTKMVQRSMDERLMAKGMDPFFDIALREEIKDRVEHHNGKLSRSNKTNFDVNSSRMRTELETKTDGQKATKMATWVPYKGPRGGDGWKNVETGNVVYQKDKPGSKTPTEKKSKRSDKKRSDKKKKRKLSITQANDELITRGYRIVRGVGTDITQKPIVTRYVIETPKGDEKVVTTDEIMQIIKTMKPKATKMATWVSHRGTRGGKGWRNTSTGKISYQKNRPGKQASKDPKIKMPVADDKARRQAVEKAFENGIIGKPTTSSDKAVLNAFEIGLNIRRILDGEKAEKLNQLAKVAGHSNLASFMVAADLDPRDDSDIKKLSVRKKTNE